MLGLKVPLVAGSRFIGAEGSKLCKYPVAEPLKSHLAEFSEDLPVWFGHV